MGLRETINKNPAASAGVVGGIVLLVLVWLVYSMFLSNSVPTGAPAGPTQAYFSDDDGATWFADDIANIAPYDHNGKQAVRCYVFSTDGGATTFAGYLERYTPTGKSHAEHARTADPKDIDDPESVVTSKDIEVKKPKDPAAPWVKTSDPTAIKILNVKAPDKSGKIPLPVLP
jgi:hypothetical protein